MSGERKSAPDAGGCVFVLFFLAIALAFVGWLLIANDTPAPPHGPYP